MPTGLEKPVTTGVESHSIDFIPLAERHGRASSLFYIWWSSNMQLTTVLTGVIAAALGLSFPWAVVAIVIGTVVGSALTGLHSAQGPILGMPQMIQSRAQFGFVGAVIPVLLAVVMYVGFFVTSNLLGGQAINAVAPSIPIWVGVVVCGALTVGLAVLGYDHIHRWGRIFGWIFLGAFLALTISLFARGLVPSKVWAFGPLQAGPFLLMLGIAAVWMLSYAVYVSDYSRYLPHDVSKARTFWYTYAGGAIASFWLLAFGALLGVVLPKAISDTASVTIGLAGPVKIPFMVVVVLGVIFVDALNTYGASMCLIAITEQRRKILGVARPARIGTALAVGILGSAMGIAASANFITDYTNFLSLLFYFLIPWSIINLVDFYVIAHGDYPIEAIFDADGPYRGVRTWAVASYLVGCAVEVPFWSTTIYTGPVAKALNGGDITWIVGIVVSGSLYWAGARFGLVGAPRATAEPALAEATVKVVP